HHRFHDAIRLPGIAIRQQIVEKDRVDLPRETEFVFEPAALPGRSAVGGKFLPEIIDFILVLAVDRERDCFGELELRAGVERHELDSVERKFHCHHAAFWPRPVLAVTRYLPDLRILKNADVEFGCLLGFGIKPQTRSYLLHTTQFNRRLSQPSTLNSVKERGSHGALRSQLPSACLLASDA